MGLRDICRGKRDRTLWGLSLALLLAMLAFSASLYLWRWNREALRLLAEARSIEQDLQRLQREYEKVVHSGLPPLPSHDPKEAVASVLDHLTSLGGGKVQMGLREGPQGVMITLSGEGSFETVAGILRYVQGTYYPVLVVRGLTMSPKGPHLVFRVEIEALFPRR